MKRYAALIIAALVMVTSVTAISAPAGAVSLPPQCAENFGTDVPVLMVHGFNSDARIWSNKSSENATSIEHTLKNMREVAVVAPFNYKSVNKQWVSHPEIGPRLADTIQCLADKSRQNGGRGKVIVIAHSMGGLALRYAIGNTGRGTRVANSIGLAVTIAAPQRGAPLGTVASGGLRFLCKWFEVRGDTERVNECTKESAAAAMRSNSSQLRQLAPMPQNVPHLAVAGDMTAYIGFTFPIDLNSDVVVSLQSALAYHTTKHPGDGTMIVRCTGEFPVNPLYTSTCEHNALVADEGVHARIISSISEFLRSQGLPQTPEPTPSVPGPTPSAPEPPMPSPTPPTP